MGNIVRINNALENMPKTVQNLQNRLENLTTEQIAAKAEVDTPFPKEQEYKEKSQRLTQLNIELDNSEKEEEQSEHTDIDPEKKPSVLKALKDFKEELKVGDGIKEVPQKVYAER